MYRQLSCSWISAFSENFCWLDTDAVLPCDQLGGLIVQGLLKICQLPSLLFYDNDWAVQKVWIITSCFAFRIWELQRWWWLVWSSVILLPQFLGSVKMIMILEFCGWGPKLPTKECSWMMLNCGIILVFQIPLRGTPHQVTYHPDVNLYALIMSTPVSVTVLPFHTSFIVFCFVSIIWYLCFHGYLH